MKKAIIYVHGKGGNAAEAEYDELANRYDEMGECQRRRAEKQKKDPCKLRRNAIVGVSLLCTEQSDKMGC